jgi:hypothetical protein
MVSRRRIVMLVASVMVLSVAGWAQAAQIAPVRFIGGGTDQEYPSVNTDWVGWNNNSTGAPTHYDAYVRPLSGGHPTGTSVKLNASGTFGFAPDLQSDANEAAFQQANAARTQSSVLTVDLDTHPFNPVAPTGLNTSDWEYQPTISHSWILFGRETDTNSSVILYNRSTHATTTLVNVKRLKNGYSPVTPDDVTETYATWTRCASVCNVYYYDVSSHVTTQVPNPNKTFYYASSVSDATGNMYFVRSGNGCGTTVKIFRWHIGDVPPFTVVASLPAGYDAFDKTSTFNDGTQDNVFFNRVRCAGKYYADIYEIPAADTA